LSLRDYLFEGYSRKLPENLDFSTSNSEEFEHLKSFPIMRGKQCLYIMDWTNLKISFIKGVEEMLGYALKEFNANVTGGFFHPDDKPIVEKIIRGAMDHLIYNTGDTKQIYHLMTYRIRKKNGEFIKVLRKSIGYKFDSQDIMTSSITLLTDISFMSNSNRVEWDLYIKDLDKEKLRRNIHKQFAGFFSLRELEIIKLIKEGLSSKMIANKIYLSPHTVKTHRRNIMKKIGGGNVTELLSFCHQNGII